MAALLLAGATLPQAPPCTDPLILRIPSSWYVSLVARYRGGGREAAVSEFIPSERFLGEIAKLGLLLSYRKSHRDCPVPAFLEAVTREPVVTLQAAVLLHTDRALWRLEGDDIVSRAELALAPLLLGLMDDAARRAFEPRWARACSIELARHGRWGRAQGELERAVKRYPDDPLLLLARGAVLESRWRLEQARTFDGPRVWNALRPPRRRGQEKPLERAETDYRQALALRKDLLHARVRLGRVLHFLDRPPESVRELQAALAEGAPPDATDVYLAHLFLGSVHEEAGALDRAAAEYQGALRALPDAQAAAVALSHLRHRGGQWPAAREAPEAGVAHAGRRLAADPWWHYVSAQIENPLALFEDLRREVSQ